MEKHIKMETKTVTNWTIMEHSKYVLDSFKDYINLATNGHIILNPSFVELLKLACSCIEYLLRCEAVFEIGNHKSTNKSNANLCSEQKSENQPAVNFTSEPDICFKLKKINNMKADFLISQELFWKNQLREVENQYRKKFKKIMNEYYQRERLKKDTAIQTDVTDLKVAATRDIGVLANTFRKRADKRLALERCTESVPSDGKCSVENSVADVKKTDQPAVVKTREVAKNHERELYKKVKVVEQLEGKVKNLGLDPNCTRLSNIEFKNKMALVKLQENATAKNVRGFYHWKKVCVERLENHFRERKNQNDELPSVNRENSSKSSAIILVKPKSDVA